MTFNVGTNIDVTETGLTAYKGLDLWIDLASGLPELHSNSGHTEESFWEYRKEKIAVCVMETVTEEKVLAAYQSRHTSGSLYAEPEGELDVELELRCPHNIADHLCGIHASKSYDQARQYVLHDSKSHDGKLWLGGVFVALNLWGKVLEGPKGYRAEKAYPSAFYLQESTPDDLKIACVEAYGVKILTEKDNEELFKLLRGDAALQEAKRMQTVVEKQAPHIGVLLAEGVDPEIHPVGSQGVDTLRKFVSTRDDG